MNQILENKKIRLQKKKHYKLQFYIFLAFAICIVIYLSYIKINEIKSSKISNVIAQSYSISHLYSNSTNSNLTTNKSEFSIIGTIKIPKLNLSYPIFSEYSDELLKISVCKFYGPKLNSVGNLCIIGHNYNNGNLFSNLYKLSVNDVIDIYDTNSNIVSYKIYKIYEVDANNLSYLDQNTNRRKRNNISYL